MKSRTRVFAKRYMTRRIFDMNQPKYYGMSFAEIATNESDQFPNHRIRGGSIRIEEIFRDEYRLHRDRLKNRGVLFLEQLIEPYANRMMKWSHFLAKDNLCKGPEPLWYKKW
ncbi:unnamed protein product [Rhizophagus irregularis]|nr:unnamed protein product [Rhizophagus irregularis]